MFCDIERGKYFELRDLGAFIWNLLETPADLEAIVSGVVEEYDVEPAQCEADVRKFLDQLCDAGCLTETDEAPAGQ